MTLRTLLSYTIIAGYYVYFSMVWYLFWNFWEEYKFSKKSKKELTIREAYEKVLDAIIIAKREVDAYEALINKEK